VPFLPKCQFVAAVGNVPTFTHVSTWVPSIKKVTFVPSVCNTYRCFAPVRSVDAVTVVTVWFVPSALTTGLVPEMSMYQPVPAVEVESRIIGIPAAPPAPCADQNAIAAWLVPTGTVISEAAPSVVTAVPPSCTNPEAASVGEET
jgi:hypothetical protein